MSLLAYLMSILGTIALGLAGARAAEADAGQPTPAESSGPATRRMRRGRALGEAGRAGGKDRDVYRRFAR
jgi:hypothetical protein